LPQLKAKWKYKVTALDGSRIRKVAFINFRSKSGKYILPTNIVSIKTFNKVGPGWLNELGSWIT